MISNRVKELYQRADRVSGNRLDILKDAIRTFMITRASQASASIAYYVLFSLFPLLLVLISAGSFLLDSEQVYVKVTQLIQQTGPATSYDWIAENLHYVLKQRGPVGIIGLATLLWAASGGFICLAYNINLAWLEAPQRNFFQGRLIGLQMIAALSGLFFMTLVLDTITGLLNLINLPIISVLSLDIWKWFYGFFSWGAIFLLFFLLYDLVPTVNVPGRAAFWGAMSSLGRLEDRHSPVCLVRQERLQPVRACLWIRGNACCVYVSDLHSFHRHPLWSAPDLSHRSQD